MTRTEKAALLRRAATEIDTLRYEAGHISVSDGTASQFRTWAAELESAHEDAQGLGADALLAAQNLLARIHRDGGHHASRVGFIQACLDAEVTIVNERYIALQRHEDAMRDADMADQRSGGLDHSELTSILMETIDALGITGRTVDFREVPTLVRTERHNAEVYRQEYEKLREARKP